MGTDPTPPPHPQVGGEEPAEGRNRKTGQNCRKILPVLERWKKLSASNLPQENITITGKKITVTNTTESFEEWKMRRQAVKRKAENNDPESTAEDTTDKAHLHHKKCRNESKIESEKNVNRNSNPITNIYCSSSRVNDRGGTGACPQGVAVVAGGDREGVADMGVQSARANSDVSSARADQNNSGSDWLLRLGEKFKNKKPASPGRQEKKGKVCKNKK